MNPDEDIDDEIIKDAETVPTQVKMAKLIMDRIHNRDSNLGAVLTLATGMPGVAKTSVDLAFVEDTCINYPNEKVFWRSNYNTPLQFLKLSSNRWHIMKQEESKVSFQDINTGQEIDVKYTSFINYEDLYQKAKPGKVNAVFFQQTGFWRDYIYWLLDGKGTDWATVCLDDGASLCPSFARGDEWHEVEKFVDTLKDIRKCRLNVHFNTQSHVDLYFKFLTKVIVMIYLFGARTSKHGRVTQKAIDRLKLDGRFGNESWIELGFSVFGKVRFPRIYKPNPNYLWSAKRTGKYKAR